MMKPDMCPLYADWYHIRAWRFMRNGQYQEAISEINKAISVAMHKDVRAKMVIKKKIDIMIAKLFFVCIAMAVEQKSLVTKELEQPVAVEEKKSFFRKLVQFFVSKQETVIAKQEKAVSQEDILVAGGKACAEQLATLLENQCKLSSGEWKVKDVARTSDFYYKERYIRFAEFMIAMFRGSSEEVKAAFEAMGGSMRCRLCMHGECMRMEVARALYAWYQGKTQEAVEIFAALLEKQPYNLFALCGMQMKGTEK